MIFILPIVNYYPRTTLRLLVLSLLVCSISVNAAERCIPTGQWFEPATKSVLSDSQVLPRILSKPIMLFGEHHQNPDHHLWHLDWLKRLNHEVEDLEIAIEMLPVQSQAVIDQWLHGALSDDEFIQQSHWDEYWAHDVTLYLPVLKYAKEKQIPIHAINVSKQLFKEVSLRGWSEIPKDKREGLSDPGPASRAYLTQLARSFRRHALPSGENISPEEGKRFKRFIEVQLLWDRAMAEGIARIHQQSHAPHVMAFMGSGHMMHGFGAPSQLEHMKLTGYTIVVPWDDHLDCAELQPGFADIVYGSPPNRN